MNTVRMGSTFDSFLEEEGIKQAVELLARRKSLVTKIERAARSSSGVARLTPGLYDDTRTAKS